MGVLEVAGLLLGRREAPWVTPKDGPAVLGEFHVETRVMMSPMVVRSETNEPAVAPTGCACRARDGECEACDGEERERGEWDTMGDGGLSGTVAPENMGLGRAGEELRLWG